MAFPYFFFGSWSFFFGPWVVFVPYVLFRCHCAPHRGDVYSGAQCVKLLLRISVEPADDRDPWRRDRFLLKTTRNDREMILEIGKAWLNGQIWWNYGTRPIMVLQYYVHLSRIFQMPFFSGSIVVFHWGHVGGRISILKIKRTKLREIASRPGLGVPKVGLRAISIDTYGAALATTPPHHQWVWVYSILWFFWSPPPVACGGPPPVDCAGGMYLSFYLSIFLSMYVCMYVSK